MVKSIHIRIKWYFFSISNKLNILDKIYFGWDTFLQDLTFDLFLA